ncbi:hypothetical protein Hanom_Chr09g00852961 [Helianthus anomalus]
MKYEYKGIPVSINGKYNNLAKKESYKKRGVTLGPVLYAASRPVHVFLYPAHHILADLYSAHPVHAAHPILSPNFPCLICLSLARPCRSFLCPTIPCELHTRHIRCTVRHPLLAVARTLRRRSSWSLTRTDDDSDLFIFI